jgi:hypothetical protein
MLFSVKLAYFLRSDIPTIDFVTGIVWHIPDFKILLLFMGEIKSCKLLGPYFVSKVSIRLYVLCYASS